MLPFSFRTCALYKYHMLVEQQENKALFVSAVARREFDFTTHGRPVKIWIPPHVKAWGRSEADTWHLKSSERGFFDLAFPHPKKPN